MAALAAVATLTIAGAAQALPISGAAAVSGAATANVGTTDGAVTQVQWRRHRHYYGYRRHWRPYRAYRPYYYGYRPYYGRRHHWHHRHWRFGSLAGDRAAALDL
jgi:hypothetical protein